jgi:hypothetical protein
VHQPKTSASRSAKSHTEKYKLEFFATKNHRSGKSAFAAEERLVSAACPLNSLNAHLLGGARREQQREEGALIKIHFRRNAVSILRSWTKHTLYAFVLRLGVRALYSH